MRGSKINRPQSPKATFPGESPLQYKAHVSSWKMLVVSEGGDTEGSRFSGWACRACIEAGQGGCCCHHQPALRAHLGLSTARCSWSLNLCSVRKIPGAWLHPPEGLSSLGVCGLRDRDGQIRCRRACRSPGNLLHRQVIARMGASCLCHVEI